MRRVKPIELNQKAEAKDWPVVFRYLSESQINVVKGSNEKTLLIIAVEQNLIEIINQLFSYSIIDVNLSDQFGNSPLFYAVQNGNFDIVELLIKKGANLDKKNDDGFRPVDIASANGDLQIFKFLYSKMFKINDSNDDLTTIIDLALKNNRLNILAYLFSDDLKDCHQNIYKKINYKEYQFSNEVLALARIMLDYDLNQNLHESDYLIKIKQHILMSCRKTIKAINNELNFESFNNFFNQFIRYCEENKNDINALEHYIIRVSSKVSNFIKCIDITVKEDLKFSNNEIFYAEDLLARLTSDSIDIIALDDLKTNFIVDNEQKKSNQSSCCRIC
ncbi:MAG: ankyrin repeat domain-containing protein [Rickettsiales bacterium]|nr:ankyrin repeat domain-containing protein [Rickettsiales bacterium]